MGFNFNFGWNGSQTPPLAVEKDNQGNIFYKMFSSNGSFTSISTDREKLETILKNPACLKVFKLNCYLASLGKVSEYKNETMFLKNALKTIQKAPNKHQTWKQFFWDYMFYNMLGTAYLWRSNNTNLTASNTSFYWLNPAKITFPNSLETKLDKLDLSDKTINDQGKEHIRYSFKDGTEKNIPLKEIQPFFDLSNSVSQNWYKGNSAIDALYKVIANHEKGLDAKNVNLDYSKKFLVAGQADPENVDQMPMAETEKRDIETKLSGEKTVHAVKSMIEINRFVDDLAALKLDEAQTADYFTIGSMFNIPRDVLEAYLKGGGTYENQEKGTGKHISYSIQPKMDDLMEWFGGFLGIELRMEYTHLPFMQYVEADKAKTTKTKAEAFKIFLENGLSKDEALKLTGLEL